MDKFMLLYHNAAVTEEAYWDLSPEAMQAELAKWNTWIGGLAAQGRLVSAEALQPRGKVLRRRGELGTDGPFTEGKEVVGGFLLLQAADLDEAIRLAQGCPAFDNNGAVEVRPLVKFD
ncbi:YciI family protein [Hymenobacter terricola]|uniref:YciI family protein n=1 Tax=Hymenobacter terricola TaxID=2819236 RepID=UPI001B30F857|nr:YciI family protein [Hymenobacter terricola]